MKKTIIGITFLMGGILTDLALVFAAITILPHIDAWSTRYPSKLWFIIFAGTSKFKNGADGLGLGWFFAFGMALIALGTFILLREYFSKDRCVSFHKNP